ncbi:DUF962 domain-containing protein [Herbaspirillum lusitanum]|uniref:DUF962 domain-containing protein n=1 Tax=Herbaspirillum lusitanum TaxID=213312 RepID=A0ABW9ACB8_9BURK
MPTVLHQRKHTRFAEFYPAYLSEHSHRKSRQLHFLGSTLALLCLIMLMLTHSLWWLLAALICGYGLAWSGHYVYEKNRPTSLRHPVYSFIGDWVMYWQMLTGQISF